MESTDGARRISLAELLTYQFGYNWQQLAKKKPDNHDLLAERGARDELRAAESELTTLTEAAKTAAKIAEDAHQSEAKALRQELAASKAAENAVTAKLSLEEVREKSDKALEAFELQEESTRRKKEELERIASDRKQGIVTRNKAKAELSILRGEDPIALRTVRIKLEVAVKKTRAAAANAEGTVALSDAALARATHARKEALRLKDAALAATKRAEAAIPSAQSAFKQIGATLDGLIEKQAVGKGTVFFIQSDLRKSRQYLPKSRFVVAQRRNSESVQLTSYTPTRNTII
jgi:hypothetical protein